MIYDRIYYEMILLRFSIFFLKAKPLHDTSLLAQVLDSQITRIYITAWWGMVMERFILQNCLKDL